MALVALVAVHTDFAATFLAGLGPERHQRPADGASGGSADVMAFCGVSVPRSVFPDAVSLVPGSSR